MQCFAGRILSAKGSEAAWVRLEGGRVVDHGSDEPPERPTATGWIVPSPVDAHTHVADAYLHDVPGKPRTVRELFGPGGWKHQHLQDAPLEVQSRATEAHITGMAAAGVAGFIDFRERGLDGVQWLRGLDLAVPPTILGRPARGGGDEREIESVVAAADGVGLSGLRDMKRRDLEAWADAAHDARKPFAIHVSEDVRDDIDAALCLDPAFVVHMTQGKPRDFEELADARVPIVVCPRSNAHFGMRPDVPAMLEAGCTVAVGTDNAMLQSPDLWDECRLLWDWFPELGDETILRLAVAGRGLLGLPPVWPPQRGQPLDAIVLPRDVLRPQRTKPGFAVG